MKACIKCGAALEDTMNFCPQCHAKQEVASNAGPAKQQDANAKALAIQNQEALIARLQDPGNLAAAAGFSYIILFAEILGLIVGLCSGALAGMNGETWAVILGIIGLTIVCAIVFTCVARSRKQKIGREVAILEEMKKNL